MKKALTVTLVVLLVLALLGAGGWWGYSRWYNNNHVFVEEDVYPKDLAFLDLRGTGCTVEYYEAVKSALPDCDIRYDLPFQGSFYSDDTEELTLTSLTEEEVELLDYLPELSRIHAEGCRDYEALAALQARRPDCDIRYTVEILGEEYPRETGELSFREQTPGVQELEAAIAWLPELTAVYFDQPSMAAEDLLALCEAFPEIAFSWEKDALGNTYGSDVTEIDLSGRTDLTLEQVAQELRYFPNLEKVLMCGCGFDNETMAAFREQMRPEYKVVWSMNIYGLTVRTDDLYFMPVKHGVKKVYDYQMQQLVYCEDMLCVDVGHMPIRKIDWVKGMPHLKYLIVADGPLLYIDPISSCKELVYVEFFDTQISDYTPLLGCTALQDLNVADTQGDPLIFKDMPWLENLWVDGFDVNRREREELTAALPDTNVYYCGSEYTAGGWRQLQNYFDMRDLLEMPYNKW